MVLYVLLMFSSQICKCEIVHKYGAIKGHLKSIHNLTLDMYKTNYIDRYELPLSVFSLPFFLSLSHFHFKNQRVCTLSCYLSVALFLSLFLVFLSRLTVCTWSLFLSLSLTLSVFLSLCKYLVLLSII